MRPVTFQLIEEAALLRHGSAAVAARLTKPLSPAELGAIPDDRWLSTMTRRTFQAGLRQALVDRKWPAFETAFEGFSPERVARLHDEALEAMLANRGLIRHLGKLRAARHNAAAMLQFAAEHGSFARFVADWPTAEITALWALLAKRMKHLGGNSAPSFLRMMGKDTPVPSLRRLTGDAEPALAHWQPKPEKPTGKAAPAALQAAFNAWHQETGKPLARLSQVLAQVLAQVRRLSGSRPDVRQ